MIGVFGEYNWSWRPQENKTLQNPNPEVEIDLNLEEFMYFPLAIPSMSAPETRILLLMYFLYA